MQVKYTAGYNCSEINFWCDQMSVKGRRAGNSCVGSYLQVWYHSTDVTLVCGDDQLNTGPGRGGWQEAKVS